MRDIAIPPDTEEKVAEAICDAEFWPGMWASLDKESNEVVVYRKQAHAACLAMLKAWPWKKHGIHHRHDVSIPFVMLSMAEVPNDND